MATSGNLLGVYLDFLSSTGTARLTSPDKPLQLVTRHCFLWGRQWKKNGMPVEGGQNITWWYIPKGAGTFEEVLPGTVTTPINTQVLQKGQCDWRYTRAHSTTTKQEVLLNDRIKFGTRKARFEQFVSMRDTKATLRKIDVALGLEGQLAAIPDANKMEGVATLGATSPYSVFAHINQGNNGLWGSGFVAGLGGRAAFTVKQNINPGAAVNNSNQSLSIQKYNREGASDGSGNANLITALDGLYMDLDWEQPDSLSQYKSDDNLNMLQFLTSKQGRMALFSIMRADNDRYLMGPQDPSCPDPQFRSIPITRWDPLETAAVYDGGASGLVTEGNSGVAYTGGVNNQSAGPRIYASNGNFMHPIAHDEVFFDVDAPERHPHIPDTYVQYESTWWQEVCLSYKHQGMVAPNSPTGLYMGFYA